eukprot:TRINITY_DN1990_c0_g1_i2.p2 TRINITY_DN1990_c0_g1~~TRINITY_DN1990_c0_g1_i2.p2  ORF type:complete len:153 (+),score=81.85 TRINITY_DN1990_c0_g1_i2:77-535(+)
MAEPAKTEPEVKPQKGSPKRKGKTPAKKEKTPGRKEKTPRREKTPNKKEKEKAEQTEKQNIAEPAPTNPEGFANAAAPLIQPIPMEPPKVEAEEKKEIPKVEEEKKEVPVVPPVVVPEVKPAEPIYVPTRGCLLYTSPSPRDLSTSRMPSSA